MASAAATIAGTMENFIAKLCNKYTHKHNI